MAEDSGTKKGFRSSQYIWNFIFVLIGGLIAMGSSLLTTSYSHQLIANEQKRSELIAAYATWGADVDKTVNETLKLWIYDHGRELDPKMRQKSATGDTREETVRALHSTQDKLKQSYYRLILLEINRKYLRRIKEISDISVIEAMQYHGEIKAFAYQDKKLLELSDFLQELRKEHPVIRGKF